MAFWMIVARVLLGLTFVMFGMNHLTKRDMMTKFAESKGLPAAATLVPVSGAWIILGGLSVILGVYPLIGAWMLLAFLVAVSLTMHAFWREEGEARMNDMQHFMKHVSWAAAIFALILVNTWGPTLVG